MAFQYLSPLHHRFLRRGINACALRLVSPSLYGRCGFLDGERLNTAKNEVQRNRNSFPETNVPTSKEKDCLPTNNLYGARSLRDHIFGSKVRSFIEKFTLILKSEALKERFFEESQRTWPNTVVEI